MVFIIFLINAKYVSSSVIDSLCFCVYRLIPSLFPFMVISLIILYTVGINEKFKFLCLILDKCQMYATDIIMGCVCGFVVGAKGICKKFSNGCNEQDFNRAIFMSSNAGVGFVVGCVGCVIFNDIILGVYLYFIQILCGYILFKLNYNKNEVIITYINDFYKIKPFNAVVKSIKDSTNTMLTICGFSVFFSVVNELILILFKIKNNVFIRTVIQIFFDFSKGSFEIINIENLYLKGFLTGFCVGFGGVCAYMQICSECESYPLHKLKFFTLKLVQGVLCGLFSLIYWEIFIIV